MYGMMMDFAVLCIGLEQNKEIISVADFNKWKSIWNERLFYIR